MGKLKNLKPRLASMRSRLACEGSGTHGQYDRWRDENQSWRALYKTARWQKLRWQVLVRDAFTCGMCRRVEGNTSQLVCDHVEPHHGDHDKFWSGPFQTLCKQCHDSEKQRIEQPYRQARQLIE